MSAFLPDGVSYDASVLVEALDRQYLAQQRGGYLVGELGRLVQVEPGFHEGAAVHFEAGRLAAFGYRDRQLYPGLLYPALSRRGDQSVGLWQRP